jgi:hypothetical protein
MPTIGRWAVTRRRSSTAVASAAAVRKSSGNMTASSSKPLRSSSSAELEGCCSRVSTSAAPARPAWRVSPAVSPASSSPPS